MGSFSVSVPDELFTRASFETIKPGGPWKSMREVPTFLADDLVANAGKSTGGHTAVIDYKFERHSEPTQLTLGTQYRQPTTVARTQMRSGSEGWAYVIQPVFIGGIDKLFKDTDAQLGLAVNRTADVKNHMYESMEKGLLRGFATSGSWAPEAAVQQFGGLLSLNGTDIANGIVEEDSSGGNTVHGIPRSSYAVATYPRFHGVVADVANSASTNLFDRLVDMQTTFEQRGGDMSRVIQYGHPDFIRILAKTLRPELQYLKLNDGETQYNVPALFGKRIKPVTLPVDGANTATYKWSALGLTLGKMGLQLTMHPGWEFTMTPWKEIPGTMGCQVAMMAFAGQVHDLVPGNRFLIHRANQYS